MHPALSSLRPQTVNVPNLAILTKTDDKPKSHNPRHPRFRQLPFFPASILPILTTILLPLPLASFCDTPAYITFASPYSQDSSPPIPCDVVSRVPDTQDSSHTVPDAPPSVLPHIQGHSHTDPYHTPGDSPATPSDAASASLYIPDHFPDASADTHDHTRVVAPSASSGSYEVSTLSVSPKPAVDTPVPFHGVQDRSEKHL